MIFDNRPTDLGYKNACYNNRSAPCKDLARPGTTAFCRVGGQTSQLIFAK